MYVASRAVVAFVERIVRDPEFREWYFVDPGAALVSHGLEAADVRDVAVLLAEGRWGGGRAVVRDAVRPLVELLVRALDEPGERAALLSQCAELVAATRDRARQRAEEQRQRPWWRFWRA